MRRCQILLPWVVALLSCVAVYAQEPDAQEPAPDSDARIRVSISSELTESQVLTLAGFEPSAGFDRGSTTIGVRNSVGEVAFVARPGRRLVGTLAGRNENGLVVRDHGALVSVPRSAILKVERRIGRRSRARYAGFGALIGFGLGGLFGLLAGSGCQAKPGEWFGCFMEPAASAFGGATLGAGGGAVAGALMRPADKWRTLPPSSWQ